MNYLLDEYVDELPSIIEVIHEKSIADINTRLSEYHVLAGMIGSAFAGKLDKKAPRISDTTDKNVIVHKSDDLAMKAKLWALSMRGGK